MISASHIQSQNIKYLKFNSKGDTTFSSLKDIIPGNSYREVHDLRTESQLKLLAGDDMFVDAKFDPRTESGIQNLDKHHTTGKVIFKRLNQLYGEGIHRPDFFPTEGKVTVVADPNVAPHCVNELPMFTQTEYKSLFITQTWQSNGKYELVVNQNGRFQTMVVDDRIPIYEDTHEPIWGMSFKNPWELILIKAWAKTLNGYGNVRDDRSFHFLESFSNSNWKYYNLSKEGPKFLHYYQNRYQNGKIILKSKNSSGVTDSGLVANQASYQLLSIHSEGGSSQSQIKNQNQSNNKQYFVTIRGAAKHSWTGPLSTLDSKGNDKYSNLGQKLSLERDVTMPGTDFLNLFSAAHITAKRNSNYFTGYKVIEVKPNESKALYFQFTYPKDKGYFDFSIKQFEENKRDPNKASKIEKSGSKIQEEENSKSSNQRFLKCKYILLKDNQYSGQDKSRIRKEDVDYPQPHYETYEIEYLKGYNKGDAHFVNIVNGRYIIRLKCQKVGYAAKFAINYSCDSEISIKESQISRDDQANLLRDAFVSTMHKVPHRSLNKAVQSEMIAFGNTFEEVGYGFVAVKNKTNGNTDILLQVDPEKMKSDGYILKSKYKDLTAPFNILIKRGEYAAVVFRKANGVTTASWPPTGIAFFSQPSTF